MNLQSGERVKACIREKVNRIHTLFGNCRVGNTPGAYSFLFHSLSFTLLVSLPLSIGSFTWVLTFNWLILRFWL